MSKRPRGKGYGSESLCCEDIPVSEEWAEAGNGFRCWWRYGAAVPRSPEPTRTLLLDAALALFAEQGIAATSLREIRLAAGQRNTAALQYHFGDKAGIVEAVLSRELPRLTARRDELRREAVDLRSSAAVVVLPYAELATGDERDRRVVRLLSRLYDEPALPLREVTRLARDAGGPDAVDVVRRWLPGVPEELLAERVQVAVGAFLHAAAERATGHRVGPMDDEGFRRNLVDMFAASLACVF